LVQKFLSTAVYIALALPILLYGREIWAFIKKDKNLLISNEMMFLRRTVEYILFDHKGMKKFWKR